MKEIKKKNLPSVLPLQFPNPLSIQRYFLLLSIQSLSMQLEKTARGSQYVSSASCSCSIDQQCEWVRKHVSLS